MNTQNQLEALVASLTIEDLADRSGRSVTEIVGFALGAPSNASRRSPTKGAKKTVVHSASSGNHDVNTRSLDGRRQYESDVLTALQEAPGWTSAAELRQKVGGTPMQARAALNRLIQEGRITYQGQARATKYRAG